MRNKSTNKYFTTLRLFAIALWVICLGILPYAFCYAGWLPEGSEFILFSIIFIWGLCVFLDNASFRLGVILVGLLAFFYLFKPDATSVFLDGINYRIQDASFRLRGPLKNTKKVVIVDIDGTSLDELGQWPWPRTQVATVAKEILDDGALSLGFDIVFAEPDRMSLEKWMLRLEKMGLSPNLNSPLKEGAQYKLSKKEIEDIIFLEWQYRLSLMDPDFELDSSISEEQKRQLIVNKYREERKLDLKNYAEVESFDACFLEMARRSRELFVVDVDWSKTDPFDEPLPVIINSDEALAEVFQNGRVVAGGFFLFSLDHNWHEGSKSLDSLEGESRASMVLNKPVTNINEVFSHLKKANKQVLNIPLIQNRVLQQGAFNIVPDSSGAARYYSHLVQAPVFLSALVLKNDLNVKEIDIFNENNYQEEVLREFLTYPSLTLTMIRAANDYDVAYATQKGVQKGIGLKRSKGFEEVGVKDVVEKTSVEDLFVKKEVELGEEVFIPLDFKGDLLINFLGEGGKWSLDSRFDKDYYFPYISFSDVLQKKYPKGFFQDKYVILGSTDPTLFDLVGSPFRAAFPGLEVHATMLDNMISQKFLIDYGDAARLVTFYVILLVGVLLVVSWVYTHFWFAFLLTILTLLSIPWGSFYLFEAHFIVIEYIYMWLSFSFVSTVVLLTNYFFEGRERRFIVEQFSSLVSKDILKKLKEDPKSVSLEGAKAQVTVFFSDLEGFTSFSERLTTKELVQFLNDYFSPMTDIIVSHNGFIDKFIGDAIMAVWGVPFDDDRHAEKACLAALDQQEKINDLSKHLEEKHGVKVYARMGLASGEVAAAMTGSNTRKNYTVLGDVVNLGARLEPACKDYGVKILISETTYQQAKKAIEARCIDKIVVKGKTEPVAVFELICKKGELSSEASSLIKKYGIALSLYWDRKWTDSEECLTELINSFPEDVASKNLLKRVQEFQKIPPPDEWQGEFVKTTK
jgi:class 3 adenylate cyclase/CHASE2 domain-containing sensor protein